MKCIGNPFCILESVRPCTCKDGSEYSTFIDVALSGYVHSINCIECGDEWDANMVDDVITSWNKSRPIPVEIYYDPITDRIFSYSSDEWTGEQLLAHAPYWMTDYSKEYWEKKVTYLGEL